MAGDFKILIVSRLVITFAILLIVCGLLFVVKTEVAMNIANGLLGGLVGYWFNAETRHVQVGGQQINGTVNGDAGSAPAD